MTQHSVYCGDALTTLKTFPSESMDCVVTSPPYWQLRDYGIEGQIGLEPDLNEYLQKLNLIFGEIKRVLKQQGTCWVNLGDTYGGSGLMRYTIEKQAKSLLLIPFRFSLAMLNSGWILRNTIIWHKPACMPSSVRDRFTVDFDYLFFFVKSKQYFFDSHAVAEPIKESSIARLKQNVEKQTGTFKAHGGRKTNGPLKAACRESIIQYVKGDGPRPTRNKRCVWSITTQSSKQTHFAAFPEKLVEPCILAGCPLNGVILDPFCGSGTTGVTALKHGRNFIGIDLKPEYVQMAKKRLDSLKDQPFPSESPEEILNRTQGEILA